MKAVLSADILTKRNSSFKIKLDRTLKDCRRNKYLLLLLLPGLMFYIIFKYVPMYGILIAFKDYKFKLGIWGSPWIGFQVFEEIFRSKNFWQVFKNTLIISFLKLLFGFPAPIVFALLLNELRINSFKKVVQTVSYLPHFISWVVLSGIMIDFLSPSSGPVNSIIKYLTGNTIYFLGDPAYFRGTLVVTSIWKGLGWGAVVYLAALTGINPELYEASDIDGANRWQKIRYITLPSLTPVIVILFILNVGDIVSDDFDQIFNLLNDAVLNVGDVLSTYTYTKGLKYMQYSFSTAVGLFQNILAFILLIITNKISRKAGEYGIW
jgi:putative aldouronate transport system permease protein